MLAITRPLSPSFERCELTHRSREVIDMELAQRQHEAYEDCLVELGCELCRLSIEPELPDSVFVEDAAVVLDELAVITRPGALSRRGETVSVASELSRWRSLAHIQDPGTLDGGDVLLLGKQLFVGLSTRSNPSGIEQLARLVASYGYTVTPVPLHGCLHLKTAVTQVGPDTLLLNPSRLDASIFGSFEHVEVDPAEPDAANALWLGGMVIYPAETRATARRLEKAGMRVRGVAISELARAEAGVTCCSLIVRMH